MDPFGAAGILIPLAGMATGCMAMFGVYRLLNRWMDRKALPNPETVDEVRRLREEVGGSGCIPIQTPRPTTSPVTIIAAATGKGRVHIG